MCNYLSAIGLLDGDVYHQDGIDRHSELSIRLANIKSVDVQCIAENSFELEFKPSEGIHLGQIKEYKLNWERFDSVRGFDGGSPLSNAQLVWGLEKCKGVWQTKLQEVARSKIIKTGHIEVLEPGDWVLCGDVIVNRVTEHSRVIALLDDAQIRDYARNADITVYDMNKFPGVPKDYQPSSFRPAKPLARAHCSGADAIKALKDSQVFCENVFGVDRAEKLDWTSIRVGDNFPARQKPAVKMKKLTGKKSDLVIFDDVTPSKNGV